MKIVNPVAVEGEELATQFLRKKGYKIIERNFRKRYGEIDIIALDESTGTGLNQTLVFIEVKTKSNFNYGQPFESITPWKLRSVIKTAQFYKMIHPKLPDRMRIDAISVKLFGRGRPDFIEHIQNISQF